MPSANRPPSVVRFGHMSVVRLLALLLLAVLGGAPEARALSVQELLRAKPAVALITASVGAEVTMDCGQGLSPSRRRPSWRRERDGSSMAAATSSPMRTWWIRCTDSPWVTHELKKKAIEQACVEPALKARRLSEARAPRWRSASAAKRRTGGSPARSSHRCPAHSPALERRQTEAEVKKFSAPTSFDRAGRPTPDSGRDLALLRVKDGEYPALGLAGRDPKIGDPVHILGFPGVVLSHELLNQSATLEATVTTGAVSGVRPDVIGQDLSRSTPRLPTAIAADRPSPTRPPSSAC